MCPKNKKNAVIGSNDYNSIKSLSNDVMNLANIQIKVVGINNVQNIPRVIISNHTMELDSIIINHIFKCAFVASSKIKDTWYGGKISKIAPLILIDRGKSKNTVQKISEFLENKKKPICIFPEGFLSHPKTIARFRSGSFNTGYPVQPIILKYNPTISDNNAAFLLAKLFSQEKIVVTIHVLDVEYPPFSKNKIEEIRNKMGKVGNMALSRVSSRDIIDN